VFKCFKIRLYNYFLSKYELLKGRMVLNQSIKKDDTSPYRVQQCKLQLLILPSSRVHRDMSDGADRQNGANSPGQQTLCFFTGSLCVVLLTSTYSSFSITINLASFSLLKFPPPPRGGAINITVHVPMNSCLRKRI
jgi:hypothetical protein